MLRTRVKSSVELGLVHSGIASLWRRRQRGALVLAYHDIVPVGVGEHGIGDRSLHLTEAAFAEQLDRLVRTHDVIPLDRLLDDQARSGTRPRVAITFDDAYRGAVTAGVAQLAARGLPATIFVAPAFVGGRSFWWDALAGDEGLPEALRSRALEALRGEDAEVRRAAAAEGRPAREMPAFARCATEAELLGALRHPGITLASHTWSHPNLARLPEPDLRAELERPLAWLRARSDRVLPWLSYPYGRFSPLAERIAAEAGYVAALRVDGGWADDPRRAPYAIPRLNVPAGLSAHGFALRAAGVWCR